MTIYPKYYLGFNIGLHPQTHNTNLKGFNGMEKDDEVKGQGNSYTTEFRQYDSRIARWLSLDPKSDKYTSFSPYNSFLNNPIIYDDPKGDDVILRGWKRSERGALIGELQRTTGIKLKVGIFGKLKYETGANGASSSSQFNQVNATQTAPPVKIDTLKIVSQP